jgi:hypothetical protein
MRRLRRTGSSPDLDYAGMQGIRLEARQKLQQIRRSTWDRPPAFRGSRRRYRRTDGLFGERPPWIRRSYLGLSGGVDSSVSALLLKRQGWDVVCLWLDIGQGGGADAAAAADFFGACPGKGRHRRGAGAVCLRPFAREYLEGRTPLPCARCNRSVKFPPCWRRRSGWARALHRHRTLRPRRGRPLKRGRRPTTSPTC